MPRLFRAMPVRAGAAGLMAMLTSLVMAPVASAAHTLDQSNLQNQLGPPIFGTQWDAQTFTAGITGQLDQVDVAIRRFATTAPLIAQIRAVLPDGMPSSVVLATGTLLATSVVSNNSPVFYSVPLSPPAPSVAGTQYAIVLSAPLATNIGGIGWDWGQTGGSVDSYARGDAFLSSTSGVTWLAAPPNVDKAFKTYVVPSGPAVPEASLAVLLPLGGLAVVGFGLVLTRWRRRGSDPI